MPVVLKEKPPALAAPWLLAVLGLVLRAGDAELLSWLLAIPVGVALYGLSRDHEAVVQPLPSDKASYGDIFLVGRRRAQKPADVPAVFSGW